MISCFAMWRADAEWQSVHFALFTLHSAFKWSPKLVSHQRLLLFREALICLSYSGMNLVVPAGNAPASSGYQPGALLLSYETMLNCGFAPNRFTGRNTRFNRCVGRIRITRLGL